MFKSRFMPCPECGASVDRTTGAEHTCSHERRTDYQMFSLRAEIREFDAGVRHYLETASGRFEAWLAARHVRGHG